MCSLRPNGTARDCGLSPWGSEASGQRPTARLKAELQALAGRQLRAAILIWFALIATFCGPLARGQEDEIDIDDLIFTFDDTDGKERVALIKRLCKMDDEEVAEALITVLASPKKVDTFEIQELVFKALHRLRSDVIVETLRELLLSENAQARAYAVRILARTVGKDAFDDVRRQLRGQSLVRTAAIKALGDCGDPRGVKLLRDVMRKVDPTGDDPIFIHLSLVKLGVTESLPRLLEEYEKIIRTALALQDSLKYLVTAAAQSRCRARIRFLWELQPELREGLSEIPPTMIPTLVETVEATDYDEAKQLVFELVPKIINAGNASMFQSMLRSRYLGLRQLTVHHFLRLGGTPLRKSVQESVEKHLQSEDWLDRRFGVMNAITLPDARRLSALKKALSDSVVWVRIEAVRELGRWRTPEALDLIRHSLTQAANIHLHHACRCALAGLEEDLCGLR